MASAADLEASSPNGSSTVTNRTERVLSASDMVPAYTVWPSKHTPRCGGRVVCGPRGKSFWLYGVWGIIAFSSLLFDVFLWQSWPFLVLAVVYEVGLVATLYRAAFCDPGIVPCKAQVEGSATMGRLRDKLLVPPSSFEDADSNHRIKLCSTCEIYRPPNTHHCRVCDACVRDFDHHCEWLNMCVARHNRIPFIQFLVLGFITCLTADGYCLWQLFVGSDDAVHPSVFWVVPSMFVLVFAADTVYRDVTTTGAALVLAGLLGLLYGLLQLVSDAGSVDWLQQGYAVLLIVVAPSTVFFAGFGVYNMFLMVENVSTKAKLKGTVKADPSPSVSRRVHRALRLCTWDRETPWADFTGNVVKSVAVAELERRKALAPMGPAVPREFLNWMKED